MPSPSQSPPPYESLYFNPNGERTGASFSRGFAAPIASAPKKAASAPAKISYSPKAASASPKAASAPKKAASAPAKISYSPKAALNISKNPNFKRLIQICDSKKTITLEQSRELQQLLNDPRNVNILLETDEEGMTPLMYAVLNNHKHLISFMIDMNIKAELGSLRLKIDIHQKTLSGATVLDFVPNYEIRELLLQEKERQERLNKRETRTGFHETSLESFQYIIADQARNKHPMVGGKGGYFGGGIYFAASEQESSRKALWHGYGIQCKLKMGNILKIETFEALQKFYGDYCDTYNSYQIPNDIMFMRLREKGYDSVWGHRNPLIPEVTRILKSGDEYVVYSADQVEIKEKYIVNDITVLDDVTLIRISLHSRETNWIQIQEFPVKYAQPSRKTAKYFLLNDETSKDPDNPLPAIQQYKSLFSKKYPNETLETGDVLDFRNPKQPTKPYVGFYVKISHETDYIIPYYSTPNEVKLTIASLNNTLDKTQKKQSLPLYIPETMGSYLNVSTPEKLYNHYSALMSPSQQQTNRLAIFTEFNIHTDTKFKNSWLSKLFPEFIETPKYIHYQSRLQRTMTGLYLGYNFFTLYSLYPHEIFIPISFDKKEREDPFYFDDKTPNLLSLIQHISLQKDSQKKIVEKIVGPFDYRIAVIYFDMNVEYDGIQYMFHKLIDETSLKAAFPSVSLEHDPSSNRWIVKGDIIDMSSLWTRLETSLITGCYPLFANRYAAPTDDTIETLKMIELTKKSSVKSSKALFLYNLFGVMLKDNTLQDEPPKYQILHHCSNNFPPIYMERIIGSKASPNKLATKKTEFYLKIHQWFIEYLRGKSINEDSIKKDILPAFEDVVKTTNKTLKMDYTITYNIVNPTEESKRERIERIKDFFQQNPLVFSQYLPKLLSSPILAYLIS